MVNVTPMEVKIPITAEGYQKKLEELKQLKSVERPKAIESLKTAREHGDLSENAEYDAAKEHQAFIHKRIHELEDRIARMEVIKPMTIKSDRVLFGAHVRVVDTSKSLERTFQLVGEDEADIGNGKISIKSPIALALIGKAVNDTAQVKTPDGIREYEIIHVEYK